jgi:hypothetical protein
VEVTKTLNKIRKSSTPINLNSDGHVKSSNSKDIIRHTAIDESQSFSRYLDFSIPDLEENVPELNCRIENQVENSSRSKILANWARKHNISHTALNNLLIILRSWIPLEGFPKDSRTLLKTPRKVNSIAVNGGQLYHFGILNCIKAALVHGRRDFPIPPLNHLQKLENLITLKVGIDGVPLSKSSNLQFWPIMCSIDQAVDTSIFLISLFYGESKPESIHEFLSTFVQEMIQLEQEGFSYEGSIFNVRVRCLIADAPARSFIKCVKNHNAYYGCERCSRKGKWANRVIYPSSKIGSIYTDKCFIDRNYPNHHEGESPLLNLQLGIISQIPLDYMHLICLGVMKKLLLSWTTGPLTVRLGPREILEISRRLIVIKPYIPSEFNRKCRSLKDLKHWKATEFRTFLLYVGPFALKGILKDNLFNHFMLLHSAIFILVSPSAYEKQWVEYAGSLLQQFVEDIQKLYYREFYVYNVHSLLHLHLDVIRLGPLDNFSAFPFENSMQFLKGMIRMNRAHLSQVVRRVMENNGRAAERSKTSNSSRSPIFSAKTGDNCFIERNTGDVCVIISTPSACVFKCYKFKKNELFPGYPLESSKLGVFVVSKPKRPADIDIRRI